MIDFHTHTLFSDGDLNPSELVRRALVKGYRAIALTDHIDGSTVDFVLPRIIKVSKELNRYQPTLVLPGVEITHAPPAQIPDLAEEARRLGAVVVVVHGESPVEPVAPGTNLAAIQAGVDILAHPGFITPAEVELATRNGVRLEITARGGHSLTNGHVARLARESDAILVIDTDTHSPENLIDRKRAREILIGAGLDDYRADRVLENNEDFLNALMQKHRLS